MSTTVTEQTEQTGQAGHPELAGRTEHTALPAGKPPVGTGASPLVAQLLALGLVALGAVGVQDVLARTGALAQQPWTEVALDRLDGLASDSPVVLVVGIVAVVLGLALLPVALRRRQRRALELRATTGVRLRTRDLARLVRSDLETVDGVVDVDVTATRRRLDVKATSVAGRDRHAEVRAEIERRLAESCTALERAPRPRVRLTEVTP